MKIVVGLGNPGKKYENTRHNLGFRVVEQLAEDFGIQLIKARHNALIGDRILGIGKVMLVKPMTFMNLSGGSVKDIMSYYNCNSGDIIIVYDDCSLPPGGVRVRESGSDGGHNGMKSIIGAIGTQSFIRVRLGIGEKPPEWELADYVLSVFSDEERPVVDKSVVDAADCVKMILGGRISEAMSCYNRRLKAPGSDKAEKKPETDKSEKNMEASNGAEDGDD